MAKFGRASTLFDNVEPLEVAADPGDGAILEVPDRDGALRRHDFGDLVHGGRLGLGLPGDPGRRMVVFAGRPDLFAEIRPALQARLTGAAPMTQDIHARQIRFLWAFLDLHDASWPEPVRSVRDIDSRFGVVFRQWILSLGVTGYHAALPLCRSIVNAARGLMGIGEVAWPAIAEAGRTTAHRDVDEQAVRQLRHACIRVLGRPVAVRGGLARIAEFIGVEECVPGLVTDEDPPGLLETGARLLVVMTETGWVDTARVPRTGGLSWPKRK